LIPDGPNRLRLLQGRVRLTPELLHYMTAVDLDTSDTHQEEAIAP
jgi:hypothetical protein